MQWLIVWYICKVRENEFYTSSSFNITIIWPWVVNWNILQKLWKIQNYSFIRFFQSDFWKKIAHQENRSFLVALWAAIHGHVYHLWCSEGLDSGSRKSRQLSNKSNWFRRAGEAQRSSILQKAGDSRPIVYWVLILIYNNIAIWVDDSTSETYR